MTESGKRESQNGAHIYTRYVYLHVHVVHLESHKFGVRSLGPGIHLHTMLSSNR